MTGLCDVWISAADHNRLAAHLFPGDHDEHGAILRAGIVETRRGLRLLVREITVAEAGRDYAAGQYGYRALKPPFIHSQITRCRDERLAYLAIHNHDCDNEVAFSCTDMESHERGYPALRDIARGVPVGALVFGRNAVEADIWMPDGRRLALGEYRIIGQTITRQFPSPRSTRDSTTDQAHDRQVRLFGTAGQARLAKARVAIIGLGGIGSLVAEYAARLGIGELLLIDPDRIEASNLSRVVGATTADVTAGRLKTEIAARLIRAADPLIRLTELPVDVTDPSVAAQLRDCDYVFLCADSMRARLLVNALAHQYFVPCVQLGAKITVDASGSLSDASSVVRTLRPGEGCLWCNGFIPSGLLALESKSDAERKAQAYGTEEPNPSVITLNAVAAAGGINDFLFDYLGLRQSGEEWRYEHIHFLSRRSVKTVSRRDPDCPECVRRYGQGDAMRLPCTTSVTVRPSPSISARLSEWVAAIWKSLFHSNHA